MSKPGEEREKEELALAMWLTWLECHPIHHKKGCRFHTWIGCIQEAADVSLSLSPSLHPSLSRISGNIALGKDLKKEELETKEINSKSKSTWQVGFWTITKVITNYAYTFYGGKIRAK